MVSRLTEGGNLEKNAIKLTFSSHMENLPAIGLAIRGICSTVVQDSWLLYQLELCVVEVASNIIKHAYHRKPDGRIELEIIFSTDNITFKFYDSGAACASLPTHLDIPPTSQEIPESGRGLAIINLLMDKIEITKEEGKNVTKLTKKLGS